MPTALAPAMSRSGRSPMIAASDGRAAVGQLDHTAERNGHGAADPLDFRGRGLNSLFGQEGYYELGGALLPGRRIGFGKGVAGQGAEPGMIGPECFAKTGDHDGFVLVSLQPSGVVDQRPADVDEEGPERRMGHSPMLPDVILVAI
jgi:hypothetical protein